MNWRLNRIAAINCRRLIAITLSLALAGGVTAWMIRRRANQEFESARAALERSAFIPFDKEICRALDATSITLMQNHNNVRYLVRFENSYFAATGGGLVELAEDRRLKRVYTVLDGMPESDLLCLAVFQSKLHIGSRSEGLIVFDGKRFEQFRWTDRKAQAVTALSED